MSSDKLYRHFFVRRISRKKIPLNRSLDVEMKRGTILIPTFIIPSVYDKGMKNNIKENERRQDIERRRVIR